MKQFSRASSFILNLQLRTIGIAVLTLVMAPICVHAKTQYPAPFRADNPNSGGSAAISDSKENQKKFYTDYISNEVLAKKIADIIFRDRYGDALIDSQQPLRCVLEDGVWIVKGTFKKSSDKSFPIRKGGVAEIHISKKTGEILTLFHSK